MLSVEEICSFICHRCRRPVRRRSKGRREPPRRCAMRPHRWPPPPVQVSTGPGEWRGRAPPRRVNLPVRLYIAVRTGDGLRSAPPSRPIISQRRPIRIAATTTMPMNDDYNDDVCFLVVVDKQNPNIAQMFNEKQDGGSSASLSAVGVSELSITLGLWGEWAEPSGAGPSRSCGSMTCQSLARNLLLRTKSFSYF